MENERSEEHERIEFHLKDHEGKPYTLSEETLKALEPHFRSIYAEMDKLSSGELKAEPTTKGKTGSVTLKF